MNDSVTTNPDGLGTATGTAPPRQRQEQEKTA